MTLSCYLSVSFCTSPAYGRDIEEVVIADTSGHFKKMLVVLLQVCGEKKATQTMR